MRKPSRMPCFTQPLVRQRPSIFSAARISPAGEGIAEFAENVGVRRRHRRRRARGVESLDCCLQWVHLAGSIYWSAAALQRIAEPTATAASKQIMAWIDELLGRTLVLVAHPDDECIAFGGLLQRMREPVVVFATNGSPQDPYFWQQYGSREAYAGLRREEAFASMHAAGVKDVIFLPDMPGGEKLVDQELFRICARAYELLSELVTRRMVQALLTLAYEGGHPDHDSCSFLAAQLASALQHSVLGGAAVSPLARWRRHVSGLHGRHQRRQST